MEKTFVNREKLKEAMAKKDMKYVEIAKLLTTSKASVTRKMREEYFFSEQEIYKLVKIFGRQILNL